MNIQSKSLEDMKRWGELSEKLCDVFQAEQVNSMDAVGTMCVCMSAYIIDGAKGDKAMFEFGMLVHTTLLTAIAKQMWDMNPETEH